MKRKRAITLLELLIVITILAMTTGLVAINIQKAVSEQKFQGEVQLVVDQLRTAQDLMLIAGADVKVVFTQKDDGIEMQLQTEDKLPETWDRLIQRSIKFTKIHGVHFDSDIDQGVLTLSFKSQGSVMSRGVLRLVAGSDTRYVVLEGYPKPIHSTAVKAELTQTNLQELVQMTIEEINEKKTRHHSS